MSETAYSRLTFTFDCAAVTPKAPTLPDGTTIDPGLVSQKYRSPAVKQRTLEAAVLALPS